MKAGLFYGVKILEDVIVLKDQIMWLIIAGGFGSAFTLGGKIVFDWLKGKKDVPVPDDTHQLCKDMNVTVNKINERDIKMDTCMDGVLSELKEHTHIMRDQTKVLTRMEVKQ